MKTTLKCTVILGLLAVMTACNKRNQNVEMKTDDQKMSYVIGQQIGKQLKAQGMAVDVDVLAMSIDDVMKDQKSRLSAEEIQTAMKKANEQMITKQMEMAKKNSELGKENKVKGEKFLEENKKKEGIKTTGSGLQYEVLTEGKGPKPKETDTVKVHYRGTLLDGTEFDSSYQRNQPAQFPVRGVIKGWIEGLQLMKVGSKWKLYIPSELAYGENSPPSIPPNSVLTFEVELLEIVK